MNRPLTEHIHPGEEPLNLAGYEAVGGYQAARRALGEMSPGEVAEEVERARLRGRGGAGFPTAMKWSFVPKGDDAPRPVSFIVNADEMEPGTFKDRMLLEGNPHQLIEGILCGAYAIGADQAFIFLRWAYKRAERRLRAAIAEAEQRGLLGRDILGSGYDLELHIHSSAGRYICGEESALLTAMEGRRALPRSKPPFPPVVGLWGTPTVVQNVETVCNLAPIVAQGGQWFRDLSRVDDGGTKIYGASGKVVRPGAWELPLGATAREVLEEQAGGMNEGRRLRGFLPGGASTAFLGADQLDVVLDFDAVGEAGSRLGTGALVVLDDATCPVGLVRNLIHFFAVESCGWCTPCREGLPWIEKTLAAIEAGQGRPEDLEWLQAQPEVIGMGLTFCALAPGAMAPLASALRLFEEDFRQHVDEGRCPHREGDR